MEGVITGAFAAVLDVHRAEMNAAVAGARRAGAGLDLDELGDVLASLVAPAVEAVAATDDGFPDLVGRALFDIALGLCRQHRMDDAVRRGWAVLLPVLAPRLSADPYRLVGAVTNALANLAGTPGARPDDWIRRLAVAAPACATTDDVLRAGQVAAWRAGLAMYRDDALTLAATLPDAVLVATLDATPATLEQLARDPWFDPAGATAVGPCRVGAFRGFGGVFLHPPTVVAHEGRAVAIDPGTGDAWFVLADAFGAAVVRYGADHGPPVAALRSATLTPGTAGPPAALGSVPELTSWAHTTAGLVATSALTHAVVFLRSAG